MINVGPTASWIIFGLTFLASQNVLSIKRVPSRRTGMTVEPGKKAVIGNIDLVKLSKSIKPKNCRDVGKTCQENAESCLVNFDYMFEKCKLTCRFCSKGVKSKKCKDRNPQCRTWSQKGDCLHYVAFMKDTCKRSCNLCGPENLYTDRDERCPIWGRRGICSLNKHKMFHFCPYSCRRFIRRHVVVYNTPRRHRLTTHTAGSHNSPHVPIQTFIQTTPAPTREEIENAQQAQDEKAEEEKTRRKEKEQQKREKNGEKTPTNLPPVKPIPAPQLAIVPAPIPAPAIQPVPLPVPETVAGPVPIPAPYLEGDEHSEVSREEEDGTGNMGTYDGTDENPNVGTKKKDKKKLLIIIGETKRHFKR